MENVIDIDLNNQLKKGKSFILLLLGIFCAVVVFFSSMYKIDTGINGVLIRFGEVKEIIEVPGIHFKVPFIDQIKKVDVENIYKYEYGYRTSTAGDTLSDPGYSDYDEEATVIIDGKGNNASIVLINIMARVQIEDPVAYLFEVDDLDGTVRLALEDVVRNVMQSMTMTQALENKEEIDAAVLPLLQNKLNKYNSGLKVVQVTTQNVDLLAEVDSARQKVEEANQYKKGKQEEAEKYNNTVIPKANADAEKMKKDAEGFAAEVIASANADVAEFEALYEEYQKNPNIVKEKYYIEAMQELLENNKIVLDQTDSNNMLKFYNVNEGLTQSTSQGGNE